MARRWRTVDMGLLLNALSADLLRELIDAAALIADSDARAVVIRGAGRAFCAGVDIETSPLLRFTDPRSVATRELIMTGRRFNAREAKAAGFLNTVVEPKDVQSTALDLAALISSKPRVPIEIVKAHIAEIVSGDTSRDDNLSAVEEFDHPESVAAREPYVERFTDSA